MFKFFKIFTVVFAAVLLSNCKSDDDLAAQTLRDFEQQFNTDNADIERFLKTHTISVVDNPGFPDDQDVTFIEVPEMDPTCLFLDSRLLSEDIPYYHEITYKLYYLKLREGGGAAGDKLSPCNVDEVLTAYSGSYLSHYTNPNVENAPDELRRTEFESVPFPQSNLNLEAVVKGWSEIFPKFKPGDAQSVAGEPVSFTDFGAGILFIPSGLGYYNVTTSTIPAYSPLIFTFKLYEIKRLDQDGDGIPSWLEDLNGDGYVRVLLPGVFNPDDTDGDGAPDFIDLDDDGDLILTRIETRRPKQNPDDVNEAYTNYSFNGAAEDDPNTPYDDRLGIPSCSGDHLTPDRLRKHRDPNCQ